MSNNNPKKKKNEYTPEAMGLEPITPESLGLVPVTDEEEKEKEGDGDITPESLGVVPVDAVAKDIGGIGGMRLTPKQQAELRQALVKASPKLREHMEKVTPAQEAAKTGKLVVGSAARGLPFVGPWLDEWGVLPEEVEQHPELATAITTAVQLGTPLPGPGKLKGLAALATRLGINVGEAAVAGAGMAKEGERLEGAREAAQLAALFGLGGEAVSGFLGRRGAKMKESGIATQKHVTGLDAAEVQRDIQTFGTSSDDMLKIAKQEDLIPRVGQDYKKIAVKAEKVQRAADDTLDKAYKQLDQHTTVDLQEFINNFQKDITKEMTRVPGKELDSALAPIINTEQKYKKQLQGLQEQGTNKLRPIQNKLDKLEEQERVLQTELTKMRDAAQETDVSSVLAAKIREKQELIDRLEDAKKFNRAEIERGRLDQLYLSEALDPADYKKVLDTQNKLDSIQKELRNTEFNYKRKASEVEDSILGKEVEIEQKLQELAEKKKIESIKTEYKSDYKDVMNALNESKDEFANQQGFDKLKDVKNYLFEKAKKARGEKRQRLYEIAHMFNKKLQDHVENNVPGNIAEGWKQAKKNWSATTTLTKQLNKLAGKTSAEDQIALHNIAFSGWHLTQGRPLRAAAAATPNIRSRAILGTVGKGKESLGTVLQKAATPEPAYRTGRSLGRAMAGDRDSENSTKEKKKKNGKKSLEEAVRNGRQ